MNSQDFERDVRAKLAETRQRLDRFLQLPASASFAEVLGAFDAIERPLNNVTFPPGLMSSVHPDEKVRDAADVLEQEISQFSTEMSLSRPAYERLAALDPQAAADDEERRALEHALRDYRRSGVDKDEKTRARITELREELVRIGQEFDKNIVKDTRKVVFPEGSAALAGLPEDYVAAHKPAADGSVTITTDGPDFLPFITFAERGDLRRQLFLEYTNRAWPVNDKVLARLLAARHELAQLLGYANWAAYVTEDKMVRTPDAVQNFIEKVAALAKQRMQAEYDELLAFKRRSEPDSDTIHEWERAYWVEKLKAETLAFDSQSVRPYFAYENVLQGVLSTSAQLYGVTFRENLEADRWHDSVRCFEIEDRGKLVARFFLDMHPREGKYKHAAQFDIRRGVQGETVPEAALVCNFPEPKDGDAGLMLHDQVTTFFHEFGHLLHHLFSAEHRFLRFAGIATEWDFVEVPSQMYEEWAWDHGVLARFARHYKTGDPIPAELVDRMRKAESYGRGLNVSVQMFYALLSLSLYDRDPATIDTTQFMLDLKAKMLPFPHTPGSHFQVSFGHLHGYSSNYYTYMWSLVIAKDMFSQFKDDLMHLPTAEAYRAKVLSQGGKRDASELVKDFLGREYAFAAYEDWLKE